jgi:murein DD-endopeptidase MepM/ murein hydrolase activator NlpD
VTSDPLFSAGLEGDRAPGPFLAGVPPSTSDDQYLKNPLLLGGSPETAWEQTAGPPVRDAIVIYRVEPGDSVSYLSERFGISSETIVQANDLDDADYLSVGQELSILPVSGVLHTVAKGDTLAEIAETYSVSPSVITNYAPNNITDPNSLSAGQSFIIPGGVAPKPAPVYVAPLPAPAPQPVVAPVQPQPAPAPAPVSGASGNFIWPTYGPLFQYFHAYHSGIDISPPFGTPIYASDSGTIVKQEWWTWSYGYHLIIDHGNGYTTLYGHMSSFTVNLGNWVEQGQLIGYVGSTGMSTGPHLHFEIRLWGTAQNPLNYLP